MGQPEKYNEKTLKKRLIKNLKLRYLITELKPQWRTEQKNGEDKRDWRQNKRNCPI
jgi:hypothetical protein